MASPTIIVNKLVHNCDNAVAPDTKHYIYTRSEWNTDYEVNFLLHDSKSGKCYRAKATEEDFKEAATDLEIPIQLFYDECQAALTADISLPGFKYRIQDGTFQLIKCDEFDVKYLDVSIHDSKNQCELLDAAFGLLAEKTKSSEAESEATNRKKRDYEEILKIYDQCLQEKQEMKTDLLSRFALILNEKKAKIRALQEQLQGASEEEADDVVRRKVARVAYVDSTDDEGDFDAPTQKMQLQEE